MLGNISNVGNLKSHVKEVKTTIEHIGLYLGLIFYTAIGAAVVTLRYISKTNNHENCYHFLSKYSYHPQMTILIFRTFLHYMMKNNR